MSTQIETYTVIDIEAGDTSDRYSWYCDECEDWTEGFVSAQAAQDDFDQTHLCRPAFARGLD